MTQPPSQGGYPPPPQGGGNEPQQPGGGYGAPPPQPPGGGYGAPPPGSGYPPPPAPGGGYGAPQPAPGSGYPPPGGGFPPPPAGGYPPPPAGGYPPPPPPSGGYAPPPPGYGAPQGFGQQPYSVGDAFGWAWNKFTKNAAALVVPTLVYALIVGALGGIVFGIATALSPDSTSTYDSYDDGSGFSYSYSSGFGGAGLAVLFIGYLLLLVVVAAIQSAYLGAVLDIADGQQVTIGSFFKPRNVTNLVISTVIIGVLSFIGSFCFIGSFIVGIFMVFASVIVIDRRASAIDAIKGSFEMAKNNFVNALLTYLILLVMIFVGALLCGVGLLVAVPVAALFLAYTYRKLSGGQVAPLTP